MRVTGVESTNLFQGTASRPLQVIRVTVEGSEAADDGVAATLRIAGPMAGTVEPFGLTGTGPGESRSYDVPVAVTGAPGTVRAVTVIIETAASRSEQPAQITAAEPGWTMWMVSHFHYDPVWWNTQGQYAEAQLALPGEDGELPATRTAFELVRLHLDRARHDLDYKFVLAEVDYLKPYFDTFPGDRAELRRLIADGRVELVGGTYNEPNTNLTSAETTIRSAVYGIGFQRDVLGADLRSAWMLDVFGHDPGFPGLMAAAGLTSSSWARGPFHQWGPADNTRMQFASEFEWVSPDGRGLLTAYMPNHYGAGWTLHTTLDLESALAAAHEQFTLLAPVAATRNVLLPVGQDHVIPARWVTDVHREWNKRYLWPRFVTAIPRDFFDAVRAEAGAPGSAVWITPQTRDMNPVYTGKDVSYADTKQAQRAAETAVTEGERLATLAWLAGAPYPAGSLDKAWRQLAYGAHHDAITGTESDQVYLDLLAGWRDAWQRGEAARRDAVSFLAGRGLLDGGGFPDGGAAGSGRSVIVANALPRARDAMATVTVRLDEPGLRWLAVRDPSRGTDIAALAEGVRYHPDGTLGEVTLTFRAERVPALGGRRYELRPAEPADWGWADTDGTAIENSAFAVSADPARGGTLTITDKLAGRPVLRGPGNELVLQEEYDKHPQWGEGPWHLSPKGPGTGSGSLRAQVRAQRCPAGSRLLATFGFGDLRIVQETLLWDGADRVEFRTHVSGSVGRDRLLRVRFPASVPGGLPVYQTATAVIGRPFGVPEADTAEHWWTLDNPANQWFGVGSVARALLASPDGETAAALGVAEVITPDVVPDRLRGPVRDLLAGLAAAGVTATCSRAGGPRYGAMDTDSSLPDFRIALGGPQDNAFTALDLAACDPRAARRLAELAAEGGGALLWVPPARPRPQVFGPDADLRGHRDLPVLIVTAAAPAGLESAIATLISGLAGGQVRAQVAAGTSLADEPLADAAVALLNRGTPGAVVTPDGTLWMSLLRACSTWPSGVWIDGERRTAPDGSSFAWQHWSHTFSYALVSGAGWREGQFNARADDYNHDLITTVSAGSFAGGPGSAAAGGDLVAVSAPNVSLTALKPHGNPLAAGRPAAPAGGKVTVRLRETDGRQALARLRVAGGIEAAWLAGLLEGQDMTPLAVTDGEALIRLAPFETVTVVVQPAAARAQAAAAAGAPRGERAASSLPEPVQPVYARYWLHGKGPAPAGNVPVAVSFSPSRVTLPGGDAAVGQGNAGTDEGGGHVRRLRLTVACGPEPAAGGVELIVPDGLAAEVSPPSGPPLRYDLAADGYAQWEVTLRTAPGAAAGRYFVAARIRDDSGQLEDTALVAVGEPDAPGDGAPPPELARHLERDVTAAAAEADLQVPAGGLRLAPGTAGELAVRVTSGLASPLRGELELISPFGTWEATGVPQAGIEVPPGAAVTVRFPVTLPATAAPGWESWLLVKLMYFGRLRYSQAVPLTCVDSPAGQAR